MKRSPGLVALVSVWIVCSSPCLARAARKSRAALHGLALAWLAAAAVHCNPQPAPEVQELLGDWTYCYQANSTGPAGPPRNAIWQPTQSLENPPGRSGDILWLRRSIASASGDRLWLPNVIEGAEVYINDRLVHAPAHYDSTVYGWTLIALPQTGTDATLHLRVVARNAHRIGMVHAPLLGRPDAIFRFLFHAETPALLVALLMLLVGAATPAFAITSRNRATLLYFALFSLAFGAYLLNLLNLAQFYLGEPGPGRRVFWVVIVEVMALSFNLFVHALLGRTRSRILPFFAACHAALLGANFFTGDYRITSIHTFAANYLIAVNLLVIVALLFAALIRRRDINALFLLAGVAFMTLFIALDLLLYTGLLPATRISSHWGALAFYLAAGGATLRETLRMNHRALRLRLKYVQTRKALLEARLNSLSERMSPHFFFNTLTMIQASVLKNPKQARAAMTSLAEHYRYLLTESGRPLAPLAADWDFARNYLQLMSLRMPDRVKFTMEPASDVADLAGLQIPPFTLQPLVENALKHNPRAKVRIAARIDRNDREVLIVIDDNGGGFPDAPVRGRTLMAIEDRLRFHFRGATLETRNLNSGGARVTIRIPSPQLASEVHVAREARHARRRR